MKCQDKKLITAKAWEETQWRVIALQHKMRVPKTKIENVGDGIFQLEIFDDLSAADSKYYHWFAFSRARLRKLRDQISKVLEE